MLSKLSLFLWALLEECILLEFDGFYEIDIFVEGFVHYIFPCIIAHKCFLPHPTSGTTTKQTWPYASSDDDLPIVKAYLGTSLASKGAVA